MQVVGAYIASHHIVMACRWWEHASHHSLPGTTGPMATVTMPHGRDSVMSVDAAPQGIIYIYKVLPYSTIDTTSVDAAPQGCPPHTP